MSHIRFVNVKKTYQNKKTVIDGLNLDIKDGSFTVLLGPSGCGKTTALRMIAGLEDVTEGEIYIGERNVTRVDPGDRDIAMVFQNYALYPHMTVKKNIEFGLKNSGLPKAEIQQTVQDVTKLVGLEDYLHVKPSMLSGGQRQRVALARAISKKPKVFLMDEPLSNLDANLRNQMRKELIQLHRRLQSTFVFVTHDQVEAMTMADYIIILNQGKIMQQGTPKEIYNDPQNVFVSSFIGDPGMNIVSLKNGCFLGFRPQKASFISRQRTRQGIVFSGRVATRETLGLEILYTVETTFGTMMVKSEKEYDFYQNVVIFLHEDDMYFFDSKETRIVDPVHIKECKSNLYQMEEIIDASTYVNDMAGRI